MRAARDNGLSDQLADNYAERRPAVAENDVQTPRLFDLAENGIAVARNGFRPDAGGGDIEFGIAFEDSRRFGEQADERVLADFVASVVPHAHLFLRPGGIEGKAAV